MPLIDWLGKQGVTSYTLIPCGALAAFPLAAVTVSDTLTLAEAMPMSMAPNARSLLNDEQATLLRSGVYALSDAAVLLSDKEAEAIATLGGDKQKAYTGNNATLDKLIEAVQHALVFHIGCHGEFDTRDFLRSAILLKQK